MPSLETAMALANLRERMGVAVALVSDRVLERAYLYAEAMAGVRCELIFAQAGIPGRTKH